MSRQFKSTDTSPWIYGFGRGKDGVFNSVGSGSWSPTRNSCSGTSGATSLSVTAGSGTMADDLLVVIHQTRGTGAGAWEFNRISSGGGTSTLTMAHPLQNTYTDSGSSQAQVVKLYEYTNFTLNSGHTYTSSDWDGNDGGIVAFTCLNLVTIEGTLSADGVGFGGGAMVNAGTHGFTRGTQGEGTSGAGSLTTQAANGNGGGGGGPAPGGNSAGGGGGGGGHAASGSNGTDPTGGTGGTSVGNTGLTSLNMGGGGGSGGSEDGTSHGRAGGDGGGIVIILARSIVTSSGIITADGANGDPTQGIYGGSGGGGGGGSILIKSQTNIFGSSITATGGSGGDGGGASVGGDGSMGRIHLDYSDTYSGTTTPTINVTQDGDIHGLSGQLSTF